MVALRYLLSYWFIGAAAFVLITLLILIPLALWCADMFAKLNSILLKIEHLTCHIHDDKKAVSELAHFRREVAADVTILTIKLRALRHSLQDALKEKA